MAKQSRRMASKSQIWEHWKELGYNGDKDKCMECGMQLNYLERAHIQAKCDGGPDTKDNLVLVCHLCHILTDGRSLDQWKQKLIGTGLGSLTIANVRFPADFLLRCIREREKGNVTSTKLLELIFNDAP